MIRLDPDLDKPLFTGVRSRFHSLARAIHDADTVHEFSMYYGRYQRAMTDIRALANMIDGEIMDRLHRFREEEGSEEAGSQHKPG